MGSARKGAIVGYAEWATERRYEGPRRFMLEQWMDLAAEALADAGLALGDVDGLVCGTLREANMFVPATVVEYLGQPVKFAEFVDLGGATGTGMLWRAAAAIELGLCDVVLCALPGLPIPS
ncbi:MAG: thiolase family protein, partial [Pseudomonadales bacterium]